MAWAAFDRELVGRLDADAVALLEAAVTRAGGGLCASDLWRETSMPAAVRAPLGVLELDLDVAARHIEEASQRMSALGRHRPDDEVRRVLVEAARGAPSHRQVTPLELFAATVRVPDTCVHRGLTVAGFGGFQIDGALALDGQGQVLPAPLADVVTRYWRAHVRSGVHEKATLQETLSEEERAACEERRRLVDELERLLAQRQHADVRTVVGSRLVGMLISEKQFDRAARAVVELDVDDECLSFYARALAGDGSALRHLATLVHSHSAAPTRCYLAACRAGKWRLARDVLRLRGDQVGAEVIAGGLRTLFDAGDGRHGLRLARDALARVPGLEPTVAFMAAQSGYLEDALAALEHAAHCGYLDRQDLDNPALRPLAASPRHAAAFQRLCATPTIDG